MSEVIKCRGVVNWTKGAKLVVEELEIQPPKRNQARVKIVCNALCHSDLTYLNKKNPFCSYPMVLGHEAAGIVESIGPEVTDVQPGDHVLILWTANCKQCYNCRSDYNICEKIDGFSPKPIENSPLSSRGQKIGQFLNATMAEYSVMPSHYLLKVDKDLDLRRLTPLACGFTTGYLSAVKVARVQKGSMCAVWGLGGVGMATGEGLAQCKAAKIIGIDFVSSRFEKAKALGFTDFINPKELPDGVTLHDRIMEITNGRGLNHALISAGSADALEQSIDCLNDAYPTITMIGIADRPVKLEIEPLKFARGIRILGALYGDAFHEDVHMLVDRYREGKIKLDEYTTHFKTLDQLDEALEIFYKGDAIRIGIIMDPTYSLDNNFTTK